MNNAAEANGNNGDAVRIVNATLTSGRSSSESGGDWLRDLNSSQSEEIAAALMRSDPAGGPDCWTEPARTLMPGELWHWRDQADGFFE